MEDFEADKSVERLEQDLNELSTFEDVLKNEELSWLNQRWPSSTDETAVVESLPMVWDGNYRLLKRIARGMADVYLAEQINLADKLVVVKVANKNSDKRRRLFQEESQILARLEKNKCDGIVIPLNQSVFQDHQYIVTEFIDGNNLREILNEANVSLRLATTWIKSFAEIFTTVHRCGVIHGDIKPENLMLSPVGEAKVIDFGLSAHWDKGKPTTETYAGTKRYSSPEQIAGHDVDHRSDIYSLGVVLQELADCDDTSFTQYQLQVDHLSKKMTEPDRDQRFQTMTEVVDAADEVLSQLNRPPQWLTAVTASVAVISFIGIIAFPKIQSSWLDAKTTSKSHAEVRDAIDVARIDPVTGDQRRANAEKHQAIVEKWVQQIGGKLEKRTNGELHCVTLDHCSFSNEDLAQLKELRTLDSIRLRYTGIDADVIQHFPRKVQGLDFDHTQANDQLVEQLLPFHLRRLSLSATLISDQGVATLSNIDTLEQLSLESNQLTNAIASQLSKLKRLKLLSLCSTEFGDSGLRELKEAGLRLQILHVSGCPVSDDGLAAIAKISTLKTLGLDNCLQISDDGLGHLMQLEQLETLRIERSLISHEAVARLKEMKRLRQIYVRGAPYLDPKKLQDELGPKIKIR